MIWRRWPRQSEAATLFSPTLACRFNVLGCVWQGVRELALPQDHSFFVAQVLGVTALTHGLTLLHERQRCTCGRSCLALHWNDWTSKIHCPLSRMELRLSFCEHRASARGGCRVAGWTESLFKRTDVLAHGEWTSLLRFAADTARDVAQVVLIDEPISVETLASNMATDAWVSALTQACQTAGLWEAQRWFDAAPRTAPLRGSRTRVEPTRKQT